MQAVTPASETFPGSGDSGALAVSTYQPPQYNSQFSLRHSLVVITVASVAVAMLAVPLRGLSPWQWTLVCLSLVAAAVSFVGFNALRTWGYRQSLALIGKPLGEVKYRTKLGDLSIIAVLVLALVMCVPLLMIASALSRATSVALILTLLQQASAAGTMLAIVRHQRIMANRLIYGEQGVSDGVCYYPWTAVSIHAHPSGQLVSLRRRFVTFAFYAKGDCTALGALAAASPHTTSERFPNVADDTQRPFAAAPESEP